MAFFIVIASERSHGDPPPASYAVTGKRGYKTRDDVTKAAASLRFSPGENLYVVEAETGRAALAAFGRGDFWRLSEF